MDGRRHFRRSVAVATVLTVVLCGATHARGPKSAGSGGTRELLRGSAREATREANRGGGSGNSGGDRGHHHGGHAGFAPYTWYSPFGLGFGRREWYRSPFYDPFYDTGSGGAVPAGRRDENIVVEVTPASAAILVNDIPYGSGGRARLSLAEGRWRIELRAPGYVTQVIDLQVLQGVRYEIRRSLERDKTIDASGKPLKKEEL